VRTHETEWPFGSDADRDDPLTKLRIAVTSSHPRWSYLVSFDRDSAVRPTDAEAAMLASFLEEYKHHWYRRSYLAQLAERALDVDGGANGVVFHKFGTDDWGYRRHSFQQGWPWSVVWPSLRDREADSPIRGPFTLAEVMDRAQGRGDEPPRRWVEWKAAHPEVFGQAEPATRPYVGDGAE
jgi:hypothetical protein